jgi:dTDP-4-amino-4,6-dideoxygalactose transaminase
MARRYSEELRDLPLTLPVEAPDGELHAWHLYVIRLGDEASVGRNQFIELMSERGIGCSVHFIPLHIQPYWRNRYDLRPEDFPNALAAYERCVSLPLYTKMTDADQTRVIEAAHAILN